MAVAEVRRLMRAPVEVVQETVEDPARLARLSVIRSVRVLREGARGPRSVGTLRRLHLGLFWMDETVLALSPGRFDYHIRLSVPGFRHEAGRITFEAAGEGVTRVTWYSRFTLRPSLLERLGGAVGRAGFRIVLRSLDRAVRLP
ncbi:SRPBCC family protein [Streptomyces albidoflavus]